MSETAIVLPNRVEPSPYEQALLPWEDDDAFRALREEYLAAHLPGSPAERHIVEQLVWCDWRRRRLVLGERALHLAQLERRSSTKHGDDLAERALITHGVSKIEFSSIDAVTSTAEFDDDLAEDTKDDMKHTEVALALLGTSRKDAYEQAVAALREDSREYWENHGPGDDPETYPPNAEGLQRFIKRELVPLLNRNQAEAKFRPDVRLQAWGESLDPDRMDRLMQLDERLLRQYDKLLGMLLKAGRARATPSGG
ncbi:hypothetical protein [Hyphomonas sp.]|uniref:hypothetical protein n=1 Tax=Hyphomonas sp. TaxID=87 RepID=UPI0025C73FFE|nr:hypothetical protein [Hyphomonas sp.]MBI1400266.1 hypothetical protein [Hyphomonas sp.]